MSKSSSATRSAFWRADWFIALVAIGAVLVPSAAAAATTTIERGFHDVGIIPAARQPADRIAVSGDQRVANFGGRPWPRDTQIGEQFAVDLRATLAALADTPARAPVPGRFERTLIRPPGAVPAPPGYDPGPQAADDEGERAARTVAFSTPAVPGTAATPHGQSDGSAQTGKP